jgi:hypothetical protein
VLRTLARASSRPVAYLNVGLTSSASGIYGGLGAPKPLALPARTRSGEARSKITEEQLAELGQGSIHKFAD